MNQLHPVRHPASVHPASTQVHWPHFVLAAMALALLAFYVVQVNASSAVAWRLTAAQSRLAEVRETRSALVAQQSQLDDRQTLLDLAASQGMVPASSVVYLVQPNPVAAR